MNALFYSFVNMSMFCVLLVPELINYLNSQQVLKTGNVYAATFSFLNIILVILGPLEFHVNFRIMFCLSEKKKKTKIVIAIKMDLQPALGILPSQYSGSPIHEHEMPYHLCRNFFYLFQQCFVVFNGRRFLLI